MKRAILLLCVMLIGAAVFAQEHAEGEEVAEALSIGSSLRYIAAAIAVGLACLAGGIAVGQVGAAAVGAISENTDLSGKVMPYVGLAEGLCLWGFLVALLILFL
jgi:V/A-type H+-transporting ATPase subunit K